MIFDVVNPKCPTKSVENRIYRTDGHIVVKEAEPVNVNTRNSKGCFLRQFCLQWSSHNKMMLTWVFILSTLAVHQPASAATGKSQDKSEQNVEYTVKAAFLFNFVKFVDWPAVKEANDVPITIGIIGKDPFEKAFEPIKDKQVKGKKAIIKHFRSYKDLEETGTDKAEFLDTIASLKKCHLLFICSSEKEKLPEIIALAQKNGILTVGETAGLLEAGGIIKFLTEDNKVRFEINLTIAKQTSLTIRSQLLRLAKRVIGEEAIDNTEK